MEPELYEGLFEPKPEKKPKAEKKNPVVVEFEES